MYIYLDEFKYIENVAFDEENNNTEEKHISYTKEHCRRLQLATGITIAVVCIPNKHFLI